MEHQLTDHGLVTILRLKGDLTFQEIEDLGNVLHRTVHDTNGEIVVDLSHVGYADSSVAGQFVAAKREAEVRRKAFVLSNLSPTVRKLLHTSHTDYQVKLYDTTEEAIADLAEKARGGEPRKVVRNIRCGHEDCVFYTYAKNDFSVVAACEYPYPEEITNGPNCRCYRVNWKDLRGLSPQEESPFRKGGRKESPYSARDLYREFRHEPQPSTREEKEFEVSRSNADERSHDVSLYRERVLEEVSPETSGVDPWDFSASSFPSKGEDYPELDDPFADTNFPSTSPDEKKEPTPPPSRPTPAPLASSPAPVLRLKETAETPPATEAVEEDKAPPQPTPPPKSASPESHKTSAERVEMEPLKPLEVVQKFVEAWNNAHFEVEYNLLSSHSKAFSKEDYCARRRALRNLQFQKYGRATVQGIAEEDSHSIQDDVANVEITRLDRTPKGARCYAQIYKLLREEGHWKVQTVRDGEARKNPTVPKRGRKLNASQFFGKSKDVKGKPPTF